ncbi:MAG: amidohydrolase [Bacteroidetes bacterium]|nr:amidohydrolase [Bacteroidota bacterium]
MNTLRVTIVQTTLAWQDVRANLEHFSQRLAAIQEPTDLIVLPEMFTTGFTMTPESSAEIHGGPGLQWMLGKAKEKQCVVTGSIAVKDGAQFYNRLYWAKPDGSYEYYDKRHLFRMAHEQEHYTAGTGKQVFEWKGWKICPLVCYDLRFPVWSRNSAANPYDLLIYVANWPEVRSYPWKQLLIARAIENQAFVIGVNRIGADGNNIAHAGDSAVINPRGEHMSDLKPHEDAVKTIEIHKSYLDEFRKVFPVMLDADSFKIL